MSKKYATFNGRASREEYWMFTLIKYLILIMYFIIFSSFSLQFNSASKYFILIFILPSLAVGTRRLHDLNKSGWWLLIVFLPYLGSLILFIFYCLDGEPYPNKYGSDPKGRNYLQSGNLNPEMLQEVSVIEDTVQKIKPGQEQFEKAMKYYYGTEDISEQSFAKAVHYLKESAAYGYSSAKEILATCYYNGDGIEISYTAALQLWEELANEGSTNAQYNLGLLFYQGKGVEKNYEKAIQYLRPACENLNDKACILLNKIKKETDNLV